VAILGRLIPKVRYFGGNLRLAARLDPRRRGTEPVDAVTIGLLEATGSPAPAHTTPDLPTSVRRFNRAVDVLIADRHNDRAIEVGSNASLVDQYRRTNVPGNDFDQSYGPYCAVECGEFSGQTVPLAQFRWIGSGGDRTGLP
jgi:hypothetical protein